MSVEGLPILVESYLDGSLGAAERDALAQRLRDDDEAREAFVRQVTAAQSMAAAFAHDDAALAWRIAASVLHPRARAAPITTRRIRRRPRRASSAPMAAAAAVAAVLAVGALAFWRLQQAPSLPAAAAAVRLAEVADARLIHAAGGAEAGGDGMAISVGDQVSVGAHGEATLSWASEDTAITLAAGSTATLEREEAGKRLRLEAGALAAHVAPQPAGQPLIIATSQCSITVVGTRFTLDSTPTRTRLRVAEGLVRMRASGADAEVAVAAGQEADASGGQATLMQPAAAAAPESAEPFAGGAAAWQARKGAWRLSDGVAVLEPARAGTLLESRAAYRDFELTCRIHAVAGRTYAELQIHGGALSVELLHTVDEHDWKDVRVVVHGQEVTATVNGLPAPAEPTGRNAASEGPVGFFVGNDRALEIGDLRIRPLDAR